MFIPKKIKVGYQTRSNTYTKKLAYVIYYDESGKLRKENSWNSWRDESIDVDDFDNVPTSGFVLNKKVGGYSTGWNHRMTYTRVYDPRGFEFEITVENLLYILENCNSIKGKGLEGEFVYGWDGKDLILIPVGSPDYVKYKEKTDLKYNAEHIKGKELKLGLTYETLNGDKYIYLGKYNYYIEEKNIRSQIWYNGCCRRCGCWNCECGWKHKLDETWLSDPLHDMQWVAKYRFVNKGKHFFFAKISKNCEGNEMVSIDGGYYNFASVSKKFYKIENENIHSKFSEMIKYLESQSCISPVKYDKTEIDDISFEEFEKYLLKLDLDSSIKFISRKNGELYNQFYNNYRQSNIRKREDKFEITDYNHNNIFYNKNEIKKLFDDIKPTKITRYLENGNIELPFMGKVEEGQWNLYE